MEVLFYGPMPMAHLAPAAPGQGACRGFLGNHLNLKSINRALGAHGWVCRPSAPVKVGLA
jgi:hypothetical protein